MRKGFLMHRPGRCWPAVAAAVLAAAACLSAWAQSASGPAPAGLEFRVAPLQADIPVVAKTLSDFLTARGPASAGKGRYKWVPLRDANDPLPTLVTA